MSISFQSNSWGGLFAGLGTGDIKITEERTESGSTKFDINFTPNEGNSTMNGDSLAILGEFDSNSTTQWDSHSIARRHQGD